MAFFGTSSAAAPTNPSPGVYVPKGSLDIWRAARSEHATSRVEVAIFGDSTTFGAIAPTQNYSWVQKLRALSRAAGYTDGGRGVAGLSDEVGLSGENLPIIQSSTGFATHSGDSQDVLITETPYSAVANDVVVFQGYGTNVRLHYTTFPGAGEFTYSVDGGSATTVNAHTAAQYGADALYLATVGDPTAVHTARVTNLGYAPLLPPTTNSISLSYTASGFTSGTPSYVATATTASGETLPSSEIHITVPNGPQSITVILNRTGSGVITGYKFYRASAVGGSYQLVGTVADPGSGGFIFFTDDNTATPGAAPPSTSTAGNDTSFNQARVCAEFLKGTGIVYHKHAISGISYDTFFAITNAADANYQAQLALGLTPGVGANGFGWGAVPGAKPHYRDVKLAISALGINNQQNAGGQPGAFDTYVVEEGVALFCKMARAAGASALVVVPHLEYSNNAHYLSGRMRRAIVATALAHGAAVVDFGEALGPVSTGRPLYNIDGGPHLNVAAHDAEATFLWSKALSL